MSAWNYRIQRCVRKFFLAQPETRQAKDTISVNSLVQEIFVRNISKYLNATVCFINRYDINRVLFGAVKKIFVQKYSIKPN